MFCILVCLFCDLNPRIEKEINMEDNMSENKSIGCSVRSCEYHASSDYCTLDKIQVGTHEPNPTQVECTDCESFKVKPGVK